MRPSTLILIPVLLFSLGEFSRAGGDGDAAQRKEAERLRKVYKAILYPVVMVRIGRSGGSGTVIWSGPLNKKKTAYATYVLTNHHVISEAISRGKEWDSIKQVYVSREKRKTVTVDFFVYEKSRITGKFSARSDIVAYSKFRDLALLKLRTSMKAPHVCRMPKMKEISSITLLTKIRAIGCSLGHEPIVTSGEIASLSKRIDGQNYFMMTAPIFFGNSGGAVFVKGTNIFAGVPARVQIHRSGYGNVQVVAHLAYFIPITTIYKWLDRTCHRFVFDPKTTWSKEEARRAKMRKRRR